MITAVFELERVELASGPFEFYRYGEGAPLVYLHSGGGTRLTEPLERLAARHTVYVPVEPGFDGTERIPGVDSMQDLADRLAEFIRTVIGGPADVVAHSFGGWLALRLALGHPELVGQLVLEAPAGLHAADSVPQGGTPEEIRRRFFAYPERLASEERPADLIASNRESFLHYQAHTADADGVDQELVERLGEIQAWTLVLLGTKDGVVPASTAQLLKNRLQHVYLMYVYDAAHNIEVDQPERFDRLVGEFLLRGEAFIINFGGSAD